MRIPWKLLTVAALALAGAAGAADKDGADTYTIKIKEFPDAGKSYTGKSTARQSGVVKVSDGNGKVLNEQKTEENGEEVYTETVLQAGNKRPKKYKHVYEKAVTRTGNKSTEKSYNGRTVLFDLKDDKYDVTVEGNPPLSDEDLKSLSDKVNKPGETEVLLPKKPVKIGESWTIDIKELAKAFGENGDLDMQKSKATGKLVKVTDKDGKKIGVLEMKLNLAYSALNGQKFDPPLTADFEGKLEMAIDGSSTAGKFGMSGKMKGKSEVKQNGLTLTVDIDMTISTEEDRSAEK